MTKCPSCAEEIQDEAKVCKHCGKPIVTAQASKAAGAGCLIVVLLFVGMCVAISVTSDDPARSAEDAFVNSRIITRTLCEQQMRGRLRAPGSADFPFSSAGSVVRTGEPNTYRMRSYVDAENAFGGEVRSRFTCVVRGQGDEIGGYRIVTFEVN